MTTQEIVDKLRGHFQDETIEFVEGGVHPITKVQTGDPFIVVPAEKIRKICQMLQVIELFSFDCLSSLTAVDYPERFEVIYHLYSTKHRQSMTLKVYLPQDDQPRVESVELLWGCANWLEREVYDLFGINFIGHSDLRRIMLPDDWVGHPLRKDYQEQEEYCGIGTTRESLLK